MGTAMLGPGPSSRAQGRAVPLSLGPKKSGGPPREASASGVIALGTGGAPGTPPDDCEQAAMARRDLQSPPRREAAARVRARWEVAGRGRLRRRGGPPEVGEVRAGRSRAWHYSVRSSRGHLARPEPPPVPPASPD